MIIYLQYHNCYVFRSYPVYIARIQLASIDYQKHKDRPYKRNAAGAIVWVTQTTNVDSRVIVLALKVWVYYCSISSYIDTFSSVNTIG